MTDLKAKKWHAERAKKMLEEDPQFIRKLKQKSACPIFLLVILLIAQFSVAVSMVYLDVWLIVLASATIGTFLAFGFNPLAHNLAHHAVIFSGKKWVRETLISLCYWLVPDLSYYGYSKIYHVDHHVLQGESTLKEIGQRKRFDSDIFYLRDFYQIKENSASVPQHGFLMKIKPRWLRLLVLLVYPLFIMPIGSLYTLSLSVLALCNKHAYKRRAKIIILLHALIVYSIMAMIYMQFGYKPVLYLVLSSFFIAGLLLHPYVIYVAGVHHSDPDKKPCQPTKSIYGPLASIMFWGENYHVEHHDFPNVAIHKLYKLKKRFPHYYETIDYFPSTANLFKRFLTEDKWVYSCQS